MMMALTSAIDLAGCGRNELFSAECKWRAEIETEIVVVGFASPGYVPRLRATRKLYCSGPPFHPSSDRFGWLGWEGGPCTMHIYLSHHSVQTE